VTQARRLALGVPNTAGLPVADARAIETAARDASVSAFQLAMGVAAALVAAGGLAGAIGIRNVKPRVRAASCEGGALVSASEAAAALSAEPAASEAGREVIVGRG
jgi:hypothetical protein